MTGLGDYIQQVEEEQDMRKKAMMGFGTKAAKAVPPPRNEAPKMDIHYQGDLIPDKNSEAYKLAIEGWRNGKRIRITGLQGEALMNKLLGKA